MSHSISNQKLAMIILLLSTILLTSDFCIGPSQAKKKEPDPLIKCYKCTNCWRAPGDPVGCRGKQNRCIKLLSDEGTVIRDCANEWGEESDTLAGKKCDLFVDGYKTCYCDTDGCNQASVLPRPPLLLGILLPIMTIIIMLR
ncbi:unnamed protein product [Orchesella dallaii]|uniref:Protein sleepless n=1 Tax=Orchesella dallaii TaxID=48710 RepID=A0ABP1RYB6_9HEXA